jgi:hypothetical protein
MEPVALIPGSIAPATDEIAALHAMKTSGLASREAPRASQVRSDSGANLPAERDVPDAQQRRVMVVTQRNQLQDTVSARLMNSRSECGVQD